MSMSAAAIADEIGCSPSVVIYSLRKHGIPTRSGPRAHMATRHYAEKSCHRCGAQFQPATPGHIYCSDECRVSGPPKVANDGRGIVYPQLQDREWLRSRYETPLPARIIADELGCDTQLIYYWLAKHDIPRRSNTTRTMGLADKACRRCGETFTPASSAALFCSDRCRKQKPYECGECGTTFWSRVMGLREAEQYYGTPMCSLECKAEARRKWLTGRTSAHLANSKLAGSVPLDGDTPTRRRTSSEGGYIRIAVSPDYPSAQRGGWMLEHRYVMEQALGRHLYPTETVHHINGDGTDNRLENLQLRQGRHGKGARFTCNACGSHDISPRELE